MSIHRPNIANLCSATFAKAPLLWASSMATPMIRISWPQQCQYFCILFSHEPKGLPSACHPVLNDGAGCPNSDPILNKFYHKFHIPLFHLSPQDVAMFISIQLAMPHQSSDPWSDIIRHINTCLRPCRNATGRPKLLSLTSTIWSPQFKPWNLSSPPWGGGPKKLATKKHNLSSLVGEVILCWCPTRSSSLVLEDLCLSGRAEKKEFPERFQPMVIYSK